MPQATEYRSRLHFNRCTFTIGERIKFIYKGKKWAGTVAGLHYDGWSLWPNGTVTVWDCKTQTDSVLLHTAVGYRAFHISKMENIVCEKLVS